MAKSAIHRIFALDKSSESEPQAEEPKSSDASKKKKSFNCAGSWVPEIIAAVFSTVCIALLIGFLIYIYDRPYAIWSYSVSPNAIISIIVTAAKATILVLIPSCISQLKWNRYQTPTPLYHMQLYDQASRGAWGSFQILWRITPGLATMGALLMILSLAIDPFAQQILAFPSRSVLASNETAFVQATHAYGGERRGNNYEQALINMESSLTPAMEAAILNGVAQTSSPLEPKCTSGNCQYPDFVTLGLCSRCEDITSQTNQSCDIDAEIMKVYSKLGWSDVLLHVPENCTYTLPDGFQFITRRTNVVYNYTVWEMGLHNTPILSTKHMKWIAIARELGPTAGIQWPLVTFNSARYAEEINIYTLDNYTEHEKKPAISTCAIYPCERQYKNNVYSANDNHLKLYKEQQLVPNVNTSNINVTQITLVPPNQAKQLFPDAEYSIEDFTWNYINQTLSGLFNYYYEDSLLSQVIGVIMGGVDDVDAAMDSMTTSMTDVMRSDNTAFKITGKAFRDETYIDVRWPWIILPTLAVLFSIMLFIATATTSHKLNTVLWKDSVLPLLMFRLQTDSAEDIESLSKVDEAERISRNINVVCGEKGSPLVFSEVKDGHY